MKTSTLIDYLPETPNFVEKFNVVRSRNRPNWFFEKQCDTYNNALEYINIMLEAHHTDNFKIEKVFISTKVPNGAL